MKTDLRINPRSELERIRAFLGNVQRKTGLNRVVIGLSGGIDSTTVLYLLKEAYLPAHIYPMILDYSPKDNGLIKGLAKEMSIPRKNLIDLSIRPVVGMISRALRIEDRVRLGNVMARTRMLALFDQAKKVNGLVCGTENKSERLLGYFTRHGDAASDMEPVGHLYKTQVFALARFLKVPPEIIDNPPSAELWPGQTDEAEFGFAYAEADGVLNLYCDQKLSPGEIRNLGFPHARTIIERYRRNKFKHEVPYSLL